MPKIAETLTALAVAKLATVDGLHVVSPSLYVQVRAGNASWIMRYSFVGAARSMGLGGYANNLAAARDQVEAAKITLRAGKDPLSERDAARAASIAARDAKVAAKDHTFAKVAAAFIAAHEAKWSAANRAQWAASLEKHAYPVLGSMPVAEIGRADIEKVLTPIWGKNKKTVTASRVRNRIEQVLGYAKAKDLRSGDNPAAWKEGFKHLLPSVGDVHTVKHLKSLPCAEVPALMVKLAARPLPRALEFLILTAARTGNVLGARWSEIDFAAATWTVAGEHMKNGKPPTVPLSPQAVALLAAIKPADAQGSEHIFPGTVIGQPFSHDQPGTELKLAGCTATVHGMRTSFNEWASKAGKDQRLVQYSLAHVEGSATVTAYDRDPLVEQRRPIMAQWAKHCAG
jgi:integrase